jgi:hypothetical protein
MSRVVAKAARTYQIKARLADDQNGLVNFAEAGVPEARARGKF